MVQYSQLMLVHSISLLCIGCMWIVWELVRKLWWPYFYLLSKRESVVCSLLYNSADSCYQIHYEVFDSGYYGGIAKFLIIYTMNIFRRFNLNLALIFLATFTTTLGRFFSHNISLWARINHWLFSVLKKLTYLSNTDWVTSTKLFSPLQTLSMNELLLSLTL